MIVIKVIFIILLMLFTITKITDSALSKDMTNNDKLIKLMEIAFGVLLTLAVYKF